MIQSFKAFDINFIINGVSNPVVKETVTIPVTKKNGKILPLDVIDEEFKTAISNSYLSAPTTSKGNIIIRGDILLLPNNNNIQYKSIELTYIKKAKIVDLLLNHNSDLSSEVLEEIMSELAIFIKAVTSDNNQEFKQENLIIE
jgi:hypothetical protein